MLLYETDSRKIQKGQIFVAIKGHTVDGHDFIEQAIEKGASSIVAEKEVKASVPVKIVKDSNQYLKEELQKLYAEKINQMKLIGVTGTNGKTTTCYLTYQMLKKLGVKVAYMGTIGFYYEDEVIPLPNTTPEILTIYKLFIDALEKGCTTIVMEVSSHSLDLERIYGLRFTLGAFTNLTEDHLDYHKTMENYLGCKLKILNYIKEDGTFIVNMDDPSSIHFKNQFHNTLELGTTAKDYQIMSYEFNPSGTEIKLKKEGKEYSFKNKLLSKFNVYNFITAVALTHEYGFPIEKIQEISKEINPPKGRCETYRVKEGYAIVDYAHTPDAVEKVIDAFKELAKAKIITVLGCGGDRDPYKRPIMGKIATEKSDYVIFTNDNPRTEDPKKIMENIISGVNTKNYEVIFDRKEAIYKALDRIEKEDIVLILGKGHEDYQIIGKEKIHFDDAEQIENYKNNK